MLDMTLNEASTQQSQERFQRGDVVLFRFPHAEPCGTAEAPKSRPCLVLDVERRGGQLFAELAYGTSEYTAANRGYEIHVNREEGLAAAGLDRPTRFVGARRVTVRLDHPGFDRNPRHPGPVIGHLDGHDTERMHRVRARIHALRDIAAERRRERQGRRRTAAGVIVEKRRSRAALQDRIAIAQGRRIAR